jgi:thioredoxin reductase (NADPH)
VLDVANDDGRAVVERFGVSAAELPFMICPNGTVLKRPSDAEAAACLGITPDLDPESIYDVAIVGAGPAGLVKRSRRISSRRYLTFPISHWSL